MVNPKADDEPAHQKQASPSKLSDGQLEFSAMTRSEIKELLDKLRFEKLRLIEEARESKAAVIKLSAEIEDLKAIIAAQAAFITRPSHAVGNSPAHPSTAVPTKHLQGENENTHHVTGSGLATVTTAAIKRQQTFIVSGSAGSPSQSSTSLPAFDSPTSSKRPRTSTSSLPSLEENFPNLATRSSAKKYQISYGDTPPRNIPVVSAASTSTSAQAPQAVSPYGDWNGGVNPFVLQRMNHIIGFTGVFRGTNWKETQVLPAEIAGNCKSCGIKGHTSMHCPSEMGVAPIVGGPNNGLFRKKPHVQEYVAEARCTYDTLRRKVVVSEEPEA